ncbi:MAG TPA: hypothetical protein PK876_08065 [Elusimicrobiota bacterium]|nr:hypothetical protein [Elusimicrobiota bacterium]
MIQSGYVFTETLPGLSVVWESAEISWGFMSFGIILSLAGFFIWLLRKPFYRYADQRGVKALKTLILFGTLGLLLSGSAFCLLTAGKERAEILRWDFDSHQLTIRNQDKTLQIPWGIIQEVNLDQRDQSIEKSNLVILYGGDKKIWLPLKWLLIKHRKKVIHFMAQRNHGAMIPVMQNISYLSKLDSD